MSALSGRAPLGSAARFLEEATAKIDAVAEMFRRREAMPSEVHGVLQHARSVFDDCPFPVWAKYEDGTNIYSNPHYRETILDYQGQHDVLAWGKQTGAAFLTNDAQAAAEGGILVHESWDNPNTRRIEHGWIAKWRQVVDTVEGPRTIVWGALLSTVVGRGKRPDPGNVA